jgi:hypothetical protein
MIRAQLKDLNLGLLQAWPAHYDLSVVDDKALAGLSLLWVPHFRA